MDFSQRYQIQGEVSFQKLDDSTVIVHLGTGKIHHTNETGTRIWELLEEGRSGAEILDTLTAEFDAPAERLSGDLEAFLDRLAAENVIVAAGGRS